MKILQSNSTHENSEIKMQAKILSFAVLWIQARQWKDWDGNIQAFHVFEIT